MYNSFKRYGVTPKTASRALYFYKLVEYISKHNFVIDETILRNDEVCELPRAIRLSKQEEFTDSPEDFMTLYRHLVNEEIKMPGNFAFNTDVFIAPTREFVRRNM